MHPCTRGTCASRQLLLRCPTSLRPCTSPAHRDSHIVNGSNPAIVNAHKKRPARGLFCMRGGEGGIRTPGTLRYNGFQDRRFRPLSHLSGIRCRYCLQVLISAAQISSKLGNPYLARNSGSAHPDAERSAGHWSTRPIAFPPHPDDLVDHYILSSVNGASMHHSSATSPVFQINGLHPFCRPGARDCNPFVYEFFNWWYSPLGQEA